MPFVDSVVRVTVPATSANLGPGFDSLGLALGLRDELSARVASSTSISVTGEGADAVALDDTHLVYQAMCRGFAYLNHETPDLELTCLNRIPHGRGLGSSSAAIVGGIALARSMVQGGSLLMDLEAVFRLAAEIEGHPDNVAPATFGGFTISYAEADRYRSTRLTVDPRIQPVVFVPDTPVLTEVARGLLPEHISHAEAAANSGRTALLSAALTSHPELLLDATRDYLHQEYRAAAMPESYELMCELRDAGFPAAISGAGPTVMVLADAASAARLDELCPGHWQARHLSIDPVGVCELA